RRSRLGGSAFPISRCAGWGSARPCIAGTAATISISAIGPTNRAAAATSGSSARPERELSTREGNRMKKATTIATILAASVLISSCDTTGTGSTGPSKTQTGAGVGAIAGALLGASVSHDKTKGALLGGLLGGLAGAGIGKYLDEKDKQRLAQSTQQTIVTGAP